MNALIVDRSPARAALDAADNAYTQAVQEAVRTRDWGPVQAAAAAVHQARAALTHPEDQ